MKLTRLFNDFFQSEKASGVILLFTTVLSIALANSAIQVSYIGFWNTEVGNHTIVEWINDGMMAVFFLMIGLELKREIYEGELSSLKNAALPFVGAMGGMIVPALLFLYFNHGTRTQAGVGIPMATDIAFAIGILSLLGRRVPPSLKIFLTALAVIDDLGAIVIIAIFYTTSLSVSNLLLALLVFAILLILKKLKVANLLPFIIGGIAMWYFMLLSGVHATLAGVLLAFALPSSTEVSASSVMQAWLHKPVAFFILPLFALANTCIQLGDNFTDDLFQKHSLGIMSGLILGKPLGIFLFCLAAVTLKFSTLPQNIKWLHIIGAGFLAGIGFTMSIFITLLAFDDIVTINSSKIAIVCGSVIAGLIGFLCLRFTLKENETG